MRIILFVLFVSTLPSLSIAQSCVKEDAGWAEEASRYLTKAGQQMSVAQINSHSYLRCIKMKNYVCMYQVGGPGWNGSDGRHDCTINSNGHAVFREAKFSIRAMVRDLCSKHKRGVRSAQEIVEVRTPWCDTNGSRKERGGYARTCNDGASYSDAMIAKRGLTRCERPEDGERPGGDYCNYCNCPDLKKAENLIRGMEPYGITEITQALGLFEKDTGELNQDRLSIYISNIVFDEVGGLIPNPKLLSEGFDIAGSCD